MQEACNIKMILFARAITQPRESWFDFPISEDCGRDLRGILGHLFVTRIDLLCLLGKDKDPGSSKWILSVPC